MYVCMYRCMYVCTSRYKICTQTHTCMYNHTDLNISHSFPILGVCMWQLHPLALSSGSISANGLWPFALNLNGQDGGTKSNIWIQSGVLDGIRRPTVARECNRNSCEPQIKTWAQKKWSPEPSALRRASKQTTQISCLTLHLHFYIQSNLPLDCLLRCCFFLHRRGNHF